MAPTYTYRFLPFSYIFLYNQRAAKLRSRHRASAEIPKHRSKKRSNIGLESIQKGLKLDQKSINKSTENRPKIEYESFKIRPKIDRKLNKNRTKFDLGRREVLEGVCGRVLGAFWRDMGTLLAPRRTQNGTKIDPKSMQKSIMFSLQFKIEF